MPEIGAGKPAGPSDTQAIERLLQQAADFGLRAPELTLILGERAASLAEATGSDTLWVRAEGTVVSARVRLGLRADSVARGVAALRAAEDLGEAELATRLRTDLAVCARSVGAPLTGLAALRPILGSEGLAGADKAFALCQLVGCLSQFGRKPELDRVFVEADKLCAADERLDGDARLLARAFLRVGMSAHRRRHADILGAADAARTGLGLLQQLDDPGCDGGVVRVRLIVHLVCSLLDRGDFENAREIAQPFLDAAPRAAAIAPLGWLRMAVATRILLPSGSAEAAAVMLRDAVHSTERHGLYALTSRLWAELSHVEHQLGRTADAMECLQQTRAAEHVYARTRRQAVGLLSGEFGTGGHAAVDLDDVLADAPDARPSAADGRAAQAGEPSGPSKPDTEHATTSGPRRPAARDDKPTVPDLGLAPAPADEPAPRFSLVFEPKAPNAGAARQAADDAAGTGAELPASAGPAVHRAGERPNNGSAPAESGGRANGVAPDTPSERQEGGDSAEQQDEADRRAGRRAAESGPDLSVGGSASDSAGHSRGERPPGDDSAKRKTRHDSAHGSVAARSVLDRLGIAAGSGGGGRRRAPDAERERRESAASGTGATLDPARSRPGDAAAAASGATRAAGGESKAVAPAAGAAHDVPAIGSGSAEKATNAAVTAGAKTNGRSVAESATAGGAAGTHEDATELGDRAPAANGVAGGADRGEKAASGRDGVTGNAAHGSAAAAGEDEPGESAATAQHGADGAMGGGRRADCDGKAGHRADKAGDHAGAAGRGADDTGGTTVDKAESSAETAGDGAAKAEQQADAAGDSADKVSTAGNGVKADDTAAGAGNGLGVTVTGDWLPKLRLPPSLEPFEDFTDEALASTSEIHFTSRPNIDDGGLEPFGADHGASSFLDDELPEDAGLADLLARALAEHRAGTSSAAALVKRLGSSEAKRPVNGHSRNGETTGNGRHRTDG